MILRRRRKLAELGGDEKYWIKLLEKLGDESGEAISRLLRIDREYLRNYDELIGERRVILPDRGYVGHRVTSEDFRRYAGSLAAGVDSSSTPRLRIGTIYFIAASSACVIFPQGLLGEPYKRLTVEPYHAPDDSNYENSLQELKLNMFKEELKALDSAYVELKELLKATRRGNSCFVVLDGPLVDPPIFRPRDPGLDEEYNMYVAQRVLLIGKLLNIGCRVVGVIKRIIGNHLVRSVLTGNGGERTSDNSDNRDRGGDISNYLNDFTFVNLLFRKLAISVQEDVSSNNHYYDVSLLTRPIEISGGRSDYERYISKMGSLCEDCRDFTPFRVFHFYILPSVVDLRKRVLGVEVAVPTSCNRINKEEVEGEVNASAIEITRDVGKFLSVWTLPGQPYPLPVLLAHMSCTIKKKTAKKVLKELISRFIRDTLVLDEKFGSLHHIAQSVDFLIE